MPNRHCSTFTHAESCIGTSRRAQRLGPVGLYGGTQDLHRLRTLRLRTLWQLNSSGEKCGACKFGMFEPRRLPNERGGLFFIDGMQHLQNAVIMLLERQDCCPKKKVVVTFSGGSFNVLRSQVALSTRVVVMYAYNNMAASEFVRSGTGSGTHMRSRPPFQTSVPDLA